MTRSDLQKIPGSDLRVIAKVDIDTCELPIDFGDNAPSYLSKVETEAELQEAVKQMKQSLREFSRNTGPTETSAKQA